MVAINAKIWQATNVVDWMNARQICGTKDGKNTSDEVPLTGELVVENLNNLEELDLYDVRELDKVVIKNCPQLKKVNLLNSGVKELEVGPGLDRLEDLSIGFDVDPNDRPVARKLDKIDLSMATNLKELRCVGVQETKLIGFEKLTKLEIFRGNKNVKIPIQEFNKWKDKLDIITGPNGLDLLKGGMGPDKDDVDPTKLDGYKNRPTQAQLDAANQRIREYEDGLKDKLKLNDTNLNTWKDEIDKLRIPPTPTSNNSGVPITKEQWDNDYSKRPTRQELEKVQRLHNAIKNGAINRFGENRWKIQLEIEKLYNSIEQSNN